MGTTGAKKTFRSTWLMTVFVLGLAGYTVWEYRKASKNEGVDINIEKRLFNIRSEEIVEAKLTRKEDSFTLKRSGDDWNMTAPVVDEGDTSAIDAFLYSLQIQKGKIFRGEDDAGKAINWTEFGFDDSATTVELKAAKQSESLQVSGKNAFDGSYYLRQHDELLLGDRGLAQAIARPSNGFRSRRLWREPTVQVVSAEAVIDGAGVKDKFKVIYENGKWRLDPVSTFAIDPDRVANWLTHVQQLTPTEIITDSPSPEDLRNFLLLKPSALVKIQFKKEDGTPGEWTLTLGQDKAEDIYVSSTSRPTVYKTLRPSVDNIRVSKDYFREGKQAFRFPVEEAAEIEVFAQGAKRQFRKEGSEWKLKGEGPTTDAELNGDKLVSLIQRINEFEAEERLPVKEAKGFKPEQQIVIRDGKGQVLLDLSWGDTFKGRRPFNKNMTFRFVKTNLEKDAMGVDKARVETLIDPQLVRIKAAKDSKK